MDYACSGKVCFTMEFMPIIDEDAGIHSAMGYCGHGVWIFGFFFELFFLT